MEVIDIGISKFLTKRIHDEIEDERSVFERDRDRIIHSKAFRRLMHKTQVFHSGKGDHYRNRLTHTFEVTQIARSIGKRLKLNDELIEAIALGHDLGHTPFGHIGERTLNEILYMEYHKIDNEYVKKLVFKHNFQSLNILDNIEKRCENYNGLNLSLAVREGILKHTSTKKDNNYFDYTDVLQLNDIDLSKPSFTLEGQIVAIADEIAQSTHDLEDAIRGKIIDINDLRKQELIKKFTSEKGLQIYPNTDISILNKMIKDIVGYLINDVVKSSNFIIKKYHEENGLPGFSNADDVYLDKCINFSQEIDGMISSLKNFKTNSIIFSQEISQSDSKAKHMIERLFNGYYINPKQLPDNILIRYYGKDFSRIRMNDVELQNDFKFMRYICDHIGSMTDQFASREYNKLYQPEYY